MKKNALTLMEDYQRLNTEEKGVSFAEEGFTQLYNTVVDGLDSAGKNGMLVGAVTTGVIGTVSAVGYNMFKKFREKKFFATLKNLEGKEIVVFVKAKDIDSAEKKVEDIIKNEFENKCEFLEIGEI